jgi:cell division protein FtsI/penicillin-binding protein 2
MVALWRAFAAIANGGKLVRLTLRGGGGAERAVTMSPSTLSSIRNALARVVDDADGTAHDVALAGFPISGKTGGADSPPLNGKPSGEDKWFVAYAPQSLPTIVVAARVEHADGTSDAKHVVREVLEAYRSSSSR